MKHQIAILYVLVSLCLAVSLATLLLVAQNNGVFDPSKPSNISTTYPSTTPTPGTSNDRYTINPTNPPATPFAGELTLSASENKQDLGDDRIKVTYTITAQYSGGNNITINYSQFYLELYAPRMIFYMPRGTVNPQNSGTIHLGPAHSSETFQIIYQFGTAISNGMDQTTAVYQLKFNGTATTNWPEPYP
jgi:hypothetical protein